MIRRGFWLTAGAVTGIWGYRRVAAAGRRVSASLSPEGTRKLADTRAGTRMNGQAGPARRGRPGRPDLPVHPGRARGHGALCGSASRARRLYPLNDRTLSTDHDALPEDGH